MLLTRIEAKIDQGQVLLGDVFAYYGCEEIIAININLKSEKPIISSIDNEIFPSITFVPKSLTNENNLKTKITFIDHPGYKVWACNIYKESIRICIFKS